MGRHEPIWRLRTAASVLTAVLAGTTAAQAPVPLPLPTLTATPTVSAPAVEVYYGASLAPLLVPDAQPAPVQSTPAAPQADRQVVPAIIHYAVEPVRPIEQPRATEAIAGVLDALSEGIRTISAAAANALERVTARQATSAPQPPALLPLLPAASSQAQPTKVEPVSESKVESSHAITLTADRLVSLLGIATGVAVGMGAIAAMCFSVFVRRPQSQSAKWGPLPSAIVTQPMPIIVSDVGMPKGNEAPEAKKTPEARKPRSEAVTTQYILEQNRAVLSAMDPSRHEPLKQQSDYLAPVRVV